MRAWLVTLLLAPGMFDPTPAAAGSVWLPPVDGAVAVPVRSLAQRQFQGVIRQRYDFSCGSAALATLLAFHYGEPLTEADVFDAMFGRGDRAKIQREGFSLLDIKRELEARGYRAEGYRISLDRWSLTRVPVIALINDGGYRHFVVLKGQRGPRLLLADPARGTRTMSRSQFEQMWNGILLLITNHADAGRRHFDLVSDWSTQPAAPLSLAATGWELAEITASSARTGAP